jgi:hypothetical protein
VSATSPTSPAGPNPAGRHDAFPEILARSAFSRIELLTYSLANLLARPGERRDAFEADVRTALGHQDASPLTVRLVDSARLGHMWLAPPAPVSSLDHAPPRGCIPFRVPQSAQTAL